MKHFLIIGVLFCLSACSQKQTGQLIYSSNASGKYATTKHKSVLSNRLFKKIAPISYQHWLSQPLNKDQVLRYKEFLKKHHLQDAVPELFQIESAGYRTWEPDHKSTSSPCITQLLSNQKNKGTRDE
ncbi:hypothetical protein ABJ384_14680 (plasmid) [Acinetobacter sp. A1-4-2]|uniref:Lipoprotein n=1 Tax=Acinetobacter sp. A1-4-2 TaxID=3156489 RepID=A0AAU7T204_9GAMM